MWQKTMENDKTLRITKIYESLWKFFDKSVKPLENVTKVVKPNDTH